MSRTTSHPPPHDLTKKLLSWFAQAGRTALPWRDAPCGERDPYKVWLSEVMLQQTTCAAVIPYFEKFIAKWPDVKALAAAPSDDVMRAWAGLGYYARARNMLKCARLVAQERQGKFPVAPEDLQQLPGIGPYTAAAIAAIAHHGPCAPVDGNVIRVLTRLYAIPDIMPAGKAVVGEYASHMLPQGCSGDFAEALMDLGATVCKPKNPNCPACPWQSACRAHGAGVPTDYPKKAPKKAKPIRKGWAFWVERADGQVLLERRPDKGLLGGMTGFPTTEWQVDEITAEQAAALMPGEGDWIQVEKEVRHTFTHFHLELKILKCQLLGEGEKGLWCAPHNLHEQALPSVMKKVSALMI
ncbi:MAG: A/G-specific adenine glycosylase [Magnetovibrio sp.]|nr:A/G-specific adenine glycosylase [Magnetovibrio sp.]